MRVDIVNRKRMFTVYFIVLPVFFSFHWKPMVLFSPKMSDLESSERREWVLKFLIFDSHKKTIHDIFV